jgi:TPP-dependent pyruvate/acetoin dehydrogenase alpha subunit
MEYLKRFWNWLLSKTTIDEQIEAKVAEIKEEVQDVVEAAKVVAEEAKDVIETVKPKRGRKSKAQK